MFDAGGYLYEFNYLNHSGSIRIFFYSIIVFLFVIFLCLKVKLSLHSSVILALIKSIIFCTYFYFLYDTNYHFYDDIVYYSVTRDKLLNYGILDYFNSMYDVKASIGTNHIGFWSLVYLSLKIFGTYYYSVVAVNIIIISFASYLFYLTFLQLNFKKHFCQLFFIFSLIHWDIISWSSFLISKEPLIYFSISFLFYNLTVLYKENKIKLKNVLFIFLSLILISELRTYVFIFTAVISSVWIMFFIKLPNSNYFKFIIFVSPIIIISAYVYENYSALYLSISNAYFYLQPGLSQINELPLNFIKTLLTPLPFNIEPNYGFLFLPSILHIVFMIIVPFGIFFSINKSHTGLIPYLVFFISMLVFYSFFQELAGPRQRFQFSMLIMYWQFLPIYKIFFSDKIIN